MKPSSFLIPALMIVAILAFHSCSKSNSGGKPSISIDHINTTIDSFNQNMVVNFKFHSPSGKLSGGALWSVRNRINERPPVIVPGPDTLFNPIPSFPNENQGDMTYTLSYGDYLSFGGPDNDTLVFKFWVVDTQNHSSDTISSPKIIVIN